MGGIESRFMEMGMTNVEIAGLLAKHRKLKAALEETRSEMIRAAVAIGLSQDEAKKENLYTLLDGYLIGAGMNLSRRNNEVVKVGSEKS